MQKQFAINNETINTIVKEIQNGEEHKITELFEATHKLIQREARKASDMTGIPAEEFESRFAEALWTSTQEWDGRTNFMQRFVERMSSRRIDVVRSANATKNKGINYGALSLDKQIGSEDESGAFVDLLEDASAEILPELIKRELHGEIAEVLRSFHQKNERYAKAVFYKVAYELEGDDLAKAIGFEKYDANARQLVSRALSAFAKFANEQMVAA